MRARRSAGICDCESHSGKASAIIDAMAEQRRFSADELLLMLAFVLGDEPGGVTTVPQLSELLRSLPANQPYVDDDEPRRGCWRLS